MKTVTLQLTPKQKAALAPLFDAVTEAANRSTDLDDQRGAILGQAWEKGKPHRRTD